MLRCHAPNSQLFQPPQASSYMATEPCIHCSAPANAQTTKQKVTCSDLCDFSHSRLKLRLKVEWEIGLVVRKMNGKYKSLILALRTQAGSLSRGSPLAAGLAPSTSHLLRAVASVGNRTEDTRGKV